MNNKRLSATAMLAKGALLAHLKPRMAADSKFDLNPILAGVTAKNWLAQKATILEAIKPRLAADADLAAMHELMDSLDDEQPDAADDDMDAAMDAPVAEVDPADPAAAKPDADQPDTNVIGDEPDSKAEVLALLDKLRVLLAGQPAAADAPPPVDPTDADLVATDDDPKDDADGKAKPFTKAAMDAAISKAVKLAEVKVVARMRGTADAEEFVKPYVGKLALSFDSAEGVYKAALETLGVSVKGLHPSAFRAVLEVQPKPANSPRIIATDSASKAALLDAQFPGLAAMRVI